MRRLLLTTAMLGALVAPAFATIHDLSFSGVFNNGEAYMGSLSLDVVGTEIESGTGTLTTLGLHNATMVMLTSTTGAGYPYGIGYRANDGTDYWGLDQAFPISTNGLLFDVGTTVAQWGQHPLFAIWSDGGNGYGTAFTGGVGDKEFYNLSGAGTAGAVPEPSTWAMLGLGFAGLGLAGWKRSRTNRLAVAV